MSRYRHKRGRQPLRIDADRATVGPRLRERYSNRRRSERPTVCERQIDRLPQGPIAHQLRRRAHAQSHLQEEGKPGAAMLASNLSARHRLEERRQWLWRNWISSVRHSSVTSAPSMYLRSGGGALNHGPVNERRPTVLPLADDASCVQVESPLGRRNRQRALDRRKHPFDQGADAAASGACGCLATRQAATLTITSSHAAQTSSAATAALQRERSSRLGARSAASSEYRLRQPSAMPSHQVAGVAGSS